MHIKAISIELVKFYENSVKRVMQFTGRNTHAVVIIFCDAISDPKSKGFVLSLEGREALHQLSRLFQYVNFQHKPSSLLLTRLRMRYYMVCVYYKGEFTLYFSLCLSGGRVG